MNNKTRGILLISISVVFLFLGKFVFAVDPIFMWVFGMFAGMGMSLAGNKS